MKIGWIKLHRQILEWEWYSDTNTFRLFLHLLLKANFKDQNHKGKLVKKGFLITGREQLSIETGLSVREVRTCLERLKKTSEIAINSNSKGTEIEILNYDKYQQETNETTSNRPTNDQQSTTIEEYKEIKEKKNNIPAFDEFLEYALENKPNIDIEKVKFKYEAWKLNGWKKQNGNKLQEIKNWKSTLLNTIPYLGETKYQGVSIDTIQNKPNLSFEERAELEYQKMMSNGK